MTHGWLDASALCKRYVPETGSVAVRHVLARLPPERRHVLNLGLGEVLSVAVRRRNRGDLAAADFRTAMRLLTGDVRAGDYGNVWVVETPDAFAAFRHIAAHSLNATDAAILHLSLALAAELRAVGDDLALVASDRRLLAAARAEGLDAFDPEAQSTADFDVLIGP